MYLFDFKPLRFLIIFIIKIYLSSILHLGYTYINDLSKIVCM